MLTKCFQTTQDYVGNKVKVGDTVVVGWSIKDRYFYATNNSFTVHFCDKWFVTDKYGNKYQQKDIVKIK